MRRPSADTVAEALRDGNAEPVLAATAPLNLDVMTALPEVVVATARHDTNPTTALPEKRAGPTLTTPAAPADGTAAPPHGAAARSGGLRPTPGRQVTMLLAAALVLSVLVVSLLARMVAGDDPPVSGTPAGPDTPSATVAPSTVASPPPSTASTGQAPLAPGQEDGAGTATGGETATPAGTAKGVTSPASIRLAPRRGRRPPLPLGSPSAGAHVARPRARSREIHAT